MAGFVVFDEDRAWSASGAAWRAVVHPAAELLPEGSEPRLILEQAIRPGIHYLDLATCLPSDREAIRRAIEEVRGRYAVGELRWGDEHETATFLALVDRLLRMFAEVG